MRVLFLVSAHKVGAPCVVTPARRVATPLAVAY
jgi:hypothetical protein